MLFLQLFVFCQTAIPPEFADLAQRALDNAMNKTAKSSRETSLNVGFYKNKNIHYKLLHVLTSSNTHDIKGFAKDDKHFAIVKRKAFNLKDDFVFIDPNTEKLFNLKKSVASDDKVSIYESRQVSIFDVFTDFEIHTSTWTSRYLSSANTTSKSPSSSVKEEFNFQWINETNQPTTTYLSGTKMEYGYGASASIEADLTYSFTNPLDIKLTANIAVGAYVGCKFVIPDNFRYTFNPIKLFEKDIPIPGLSHYSTLLKVFNIDISCGLNFFTELREMTLDIPIGFNYFKGYYFYGTKSVLITPTKTVNEPWKFSMNDLVDEKTSDSLIESLTSAQLTGTVDANLTLKFNLKIGDDIANAGVNIGLGIPFQYDLTFDKSVCNFPHLSLRLTIPINFILKVDPVRVKLVKYYTIFQGLDFSQTMKELSVGPICLAPQLYVKKVLKDDSIVAEPKYLGEPEPDNSFSFIIRSGKDLYKYAITFDESYKGKYLFIEVPNAVDVYFEHPFSVANFAYCKLDSTPITLVCTRGEGALANYLSGYVVGAVNNFKPLVVGELVSFSISSKNWNVIIIPAISYTTLDGAPELVSTFSIYSSKPISHYNSYAPFGGNSFIMLIRFYQDDVFAYPYCTYLYLAEGQNSITFDYNYMKDIPERMPEFTEFNIPIYLEKNDNVKEIIMINENWKTQTANLTETPPYQADFQVNYSDYDNLVFTFMPVCNDETGVMCQITYEVGDTDGYQIIKYPDRDGISTTGQGFLIEAIPIEANMNFHYYKTFSGQIQKGKFYPKGTTYRIQPSITNVNSPLLAGNGQRVCIVNADDSKEILPFSRKYFNNNINDVLGLLAKSPDDISMDLITSDEDGCLLFDSSVALKEQITYLPKEICDVPIEQYGTPPDTGNQSSNSVTRFLKANAPIIVGAVVALVVIIIIVVVCKRRKKKQNENSMSSV